MRMMTGVQAVGALGVACSCVVAATVIVMRRIARTGPYYPSCMARVLAWPLPARDVAFRFTVPTCASGMEPVLDAFKGLFEQGHNLEAQLCIYSKGEKVLAHLGFLVAGQGVPLPCVVSLVVVVHRCWTSPAAHVPTPRTTPPRYRTACLAPRCWRLWPLPVWWSGTRISRSSSRASRHRAEAERTRRGGAGDHLVASRTGTRLETPRARSRRFPDTHRRSRPGCRGSLEYSDLVVKHWPEFAKTDPTKATITIADLLRHDAGLACFGTPAQHEYLTMVRRASSHRVALPERAQRARSPSRQCADLAIHRSICRTRRDCRTS